MATVRSPTDKDKTAELQCFIGEFPCVDQPKGMQVE